MKGIQTGHGHRIRWAKHCQRLDVPDHVFRDDEFGAPVGYTDDAGVFSSASSLRAAFHAWRIRSMWPSSPFSPGWLFELGGGYGALIRALYLAADEAPRVATIADHRVLQHVQMRYLDATCPELLVKTPAPGDRYDLVTNTNSLGEMLSSEVARYFKQIQERLSPGGVFYTVNRRLRVTNFQNYPYDEKWRHQVTFFVGDAAWVECFSVRDPTANSPHPVTLIK
jgi:hypothetical protein